MYGREYLTTLMQILKEALHMKSKTLSLITLLLGLMLALVTPEVFAQSRPEYIPLGGGVKGALYKPDSGPEPHVGILIMHRDLNYLSTAACTQLSARGFMVLCSNNAAENNNTLLRWEDTPLDIRRGINFLRSQPGITKVLLWGHSAGGPLMSFYQAVAENGPSHCQGPHRLVQCSDELANLPRADGIILADAHPGSLLRNLNPAVFNEERPDRVRRRLDPFDPENGFNPNGPSTYSKEFQESYFKGQAERMNKLIDTALNKLSLIEAGEAPYPDDDYFPIPRAGVALGGTGAPANILRLDPTIHCCTFSPRKFLKNDGSVVTQIIQSVRVAQTDVDEGNPTFDDGTLSLTVKSFLSTEAMRATHSLDYDQIEWCSSGNSTLCNIEKVSVPTLIAVMGAHYFIRDGEAFFEKSKSPDKDYIGIEGASHGFSPCTDCEQFPGQYSNARTNFFNYVRDWINARFR
jgi:hypothetical protein